MSTYANTKFTVRTTTLRGINLPMKKCDGHDTYLWTLVVDDVKEQKRYLKEDFEVCDDDLFICTYPRSGTNWTHEIVYMLLHGSADFGPLFAFAESMPPEELEKIKSPRIICTHHQLNVLPPNILEKTKIICVFRNPKDVAVSMHTFMGHFNFANYDASFEDFLQLFLDGDVPCGTWFDHVLEWEKVVDTNSSSVLAIMYEDMKSNLREHVEKIADFLGIKPNKDLIQKIAENCEFESLYRQKTTNVPDIVKRCTKDQQNSFYRKGVIGDWKNWFTVAQSEHFDKIYQERMIDSKLKFKFY